MVGVYWAGWDRIIGAQEGGQGVRYDRRWEPGRGTLQHIIYISHEHRRDSAQFK